MWTVQLGTIFCKNNRLWKVVLLSHSSVCPNIKTCSKDVNLRGFFPKNVDKIHQSDYFSVCLKTRGSKKKGNPKWQAMIKSLEKRHLLFLQTYCNNTTWLWFSPSVVLLSLYFFNLITLLLLLRVWSPGILKQVFSTLNTFSIPQLTFEAPSITFAKVTDFI